MTAHQLYSSKSVHFSPGYIHPSIYISGIYPACCSGLWCRDLTEFRVLINGLTLTQNLIIGDWLSPAFSFFFPSPCRLTDLWLRWELCDECSSAKSSELVSNLELTFWTLFQQIWVIERLRREPQTEAGRVCWCLFVNLSGTAAQATCSQMTADLIRPALCFQLIFV